MPFSAPPTILLTAASLALIAGPFFQVRVRRISEFYFLIVVLVTGYVLAIEPVQVYEAGSEATIRPAFRHDSLALCEQWLALIFGLLSGIALFNPSGREQSALPRREQSATNRFGSLLFSIAGLMLTAESNDFISLGLSLEIFHLAVRALRRLDAATDDITTETDWFTDLASGGMWLGIAILSNATATTQFDTLRTVLAAAYDPGVNQTAIGAPSKLILLAVGLIALSLFARMGLAPFSLGFSSQRRRHSRSVDGFGLLASQFAGSIALTRLFGCVFVGLGQPLMVLTMAIGLVTFGLSAMMIARGFSPGVRSISQFANGLMLLQSGWLAIGLMIATSELQHLAIPWGEFSPRHETLALIVFTQLTGLLAGGGVFWVLGHLAQPNGEIEFLEDVKGLGAYAKASSVTLITGLATLAGFPLTAGFWMRWTVLLAGNNVHSKSHSRIFQPNDGLRLVMLAGVIATFFASLVVIRMGREMFLESPLARRNSDQGRGALMASLIAALICLLLGVAPHAALGPLRTIRSPKTLAPDSPQRGSGKNLLGWRSGFGQSRDSGQKKH